ncbi:hypothetical protein Trco_007490 [Trichoderma cornu-damae]|uniref:Uncharacterized protein n=1 Tax=Trichoderma cornu-damae TaxID=654480 RepID=A0A9P8TUE0_9HYPO|nr:hypothetical protein Trco_007490 [Trichoderma cornu-damae]
MSHGDRDRRGAYHGGPHRSHARGHRRRDELVLVQDAEKGRSGPPSSCRRSYAGWNCGSVLSHFCSKSTSSQMPVSRWG